jgi:hypothetical protein
MLFAPTMEQRVVSPNRQAAINSLRRDIRDTVEDIMVAGTSWRGIQSNERTCPTL